MESVSTEFNWLSSADIPPSIANGGTGFRIKTNDWINALDWIAANTSSNSVVASWWDYGYWITPWQIEQFGRQRYN